MISLVRMFFFYGTIAYQLGATGCQQPMTIAIMVSEPEKLTLDKPVDCRRGKRGRARLFYTFRLLGVLFGATARAQC